MLTIKRIYVKNFKGISPKEKIIDFSNKITLLTGPNGFGKTTLFDVLELCITGSIHRTGEKAGVTNDTKDYKKPFYQNTASEEVIIKVWLKKDNDDLIIVKYLDKNHPGRSSNIGRKNKPCDFAMLETYRDSVNNFYNSSFEKSKATKLSQAEIDKFFDLRATQTTIAQLFPLFNYLQQEETTYFLKKSERERKDSLDFLFQTVEQKNTEDKIKSLLSNLEEIEKEITQKIEVLDYVENEKKKFVKIYEDKDFGFDTEEPFLNLTIEESIRKKDMYQTELQKILQFRKQFSTEEYNKKIKYDRINTIITNDEFLSYYILRPLLEEQVYQHIIKQYDFFNNEQMLKMFILKDFRSKYSELCFINDKIKRYKEFINAESFDQRLLNLNNCISDFFDADQIIMFSNFVSERIELQRTSDEISNVINNVLRIRKELQEEFSKTNSGKSNCPFCGHSWDSYNQLVESFVIRTESLKNINMRQIQKIEQIDNKIIDKFMKLCQNETEKFCQAHEISDENVLQLINQYEFNENDLKELDDIFNVDCFKWKKIKSIKELEEDFVKLKSNLSEKLKVTVEIYEELGKLQGKYFNKTMDSFREIFESNKLKFDLPRNTISLQNYKNQIIKVLQEEKNRYAYQTDKTEDKESIYSMYFDLDEEKFNKITDEIIIEKIEYINAKMIQKKNVFLTKLKTRKEKLSRIIKNISDVRNIYHDQITNHKRDMVEKIKIPFFIYTSKILQNYQQGMGVFISTKPDSDSIRFITDNSSDHDAMHHLSSGQLAVVALAFCLSINKTYNVSDNLKFLAIDDPIQEMDSLNMHSFIELIRNEFASDYQLIFSTHDDSNALYMKYKLECFYDNSVKLINVQKEFFD